MSKNEDEKIINDIKEGLDFIEAKISVNTPDIARFRRMVTQVEDKKQKKSKREIIIFVLIAAITLSVETFAFNQSILFFIIIQAIAFTSFIIGILNWVIRGNRKVKAI